MWYPCTTRQIFNTFLQSKNKIRMFMIQFSLPLYTRVDRNEKRTSITYVHRKQVFVVKIMKDEITLLYT